MLAPLDKRFNPLAEQEIRDLRRALRASRLRLRRGALESARRLHTANAELSALRDLCQRQARQIERHASGQVVVDLGRKLLSLSEANTRLIDDSRRLVVLERVLALSDAERKRLSVERDEMARELCRYRHDAMIGVVLCERVAHAGQNV